MTRKSARNVDIDKELKTFEITKKESHMVAEKIDNKSIKEWKMQNQNGMHDSFPDGIGGGINKDISSKQVYHFRLTPGLFEEIIKKFNIPDVNQFLDELLKNILKGETQPVIIFNTFPKREDLNNKLDLVNSNFEFLFEYFGLLNPETKEIVEKKANKKKAHGCFKQSKDLMAQTQMKNIDAAAKNIVENLKKDKK